MRVSHVVLCATAHALEMSHNVAAAGAIIDFLQFQIWDCDVLCGLSRLDTFDFH